MLINKIRKFAINFFTQGNKRSIEAKKNIVASLVLRVLSIAISLVTVPITIHYISPTKYGIWLTLSSMVAWISFFDIGFTNGFRNRFAQAKAQGNIDLARTYVSTTYFYVGIIFTSLWIVLISINQFINWEKLLNINVNDAKEASMLVYIIVSYFCLQFVFRIINTILIADQKPAKVALLDLNGQIISLIAIYTLIKLTSGSLIYLGIALGAAPTLVVIGANLYFFKTKYKDYAPSIRFVKKKYAKDIMSLGLKFFVIQIAAIVQYQSTMFLIAHYFDTLQVTSYNIAYKYFGLLEMGFTILIAPLWSGATDAYSSGDIAWIKNAVKKYLQLLIPFILSGLVMLSVAVYVYDIWLGKGVVNISFNISLLCYIYFATRLYATIFVLVINGIGAIKIQYYTSFATSLGFIVLSLLLIKVFHFGIESILISSIISNFFGIIIAPIQYYNIIIKKSEQKIWYK